MAKLTDYEKCEHAYKLGATAEQLMVWVKAGKITQAEYEQIVNGKEVSQ